MNVLPILWAETPTREDWVALSQAREAIGYTDLIKPAKALEGSPGPILAVGVKPSWLVDYNYIESTWDPRLPEALKACLSQEAQQQTPEEIAAVLSEWMGVEVKAVEEEKEDAV